MPPSSHRPPAEADVPHFEAAPSADMNTDEWLLQMIACGKFLKSSRLSSKGTASEGSDPAQRDAFAVIQGRNLATSLMVDTILEQWETVIQPLDVQGLVADDMEMGTKQQELQ